MLIFDRPLTNSCWEYFILLRCGRGLAACGVGLVAQDDPFKEHHTLAATGQLTPSYIYRLLVAVLQSRSRRKSGIKGGTPLSRGHHHYHHLHSRRLHTFQDLELISSHWYLVLQRSPLCRRQRLILLKFLKIFGWYLAKTGFSLLDHGRTRCDHN